ncbi:MAG: hypothetical protein Q9190_003733 [Brigantiaea leucoxantha]
MTTPDIDRILTFWFDPQQAYTRWFTPSASLDAQCTTQFSTLVTTARETSTLDTAWLSTARGALALTILLDQFPRNIYRGSPLSYAADAKALSVAARALAKGFHQQVSAVESVFFFTPFEHAEDLVAQAAAMALGEGLLRRVEMEAAEEKVRSFAAVYLQVAGRHCRAVERFGRFPARNEVLGRASTEEEKEFLRENPHGF